MAIPLDDTLHPDIRPLAWLVGEWSGTGAAQLTGDDGEEHGRRIEQRVTVSHSGTPELTWSMQTWLLRTDDDGPERELLMKERGTWTTTGLLPGQNEEAAAAAPAGSPESYLSHGVRFTVDGGETWNGEVRGPRLHVGAQADGRFFTRMFGMIGPRIMWLQEAGDSPTNLSPTLSVELDRS